MQNFVRATVGAVCLALSGAALADYPAKPVTLVSPYGPGGAADLAARTIAGTAPAYLGQAVLVVNRTGAAGVTGSTTVAKGKPDGYTLLLARVGSQAAVPAINRKIPYKWVEVLGKLKDDRAWNKLTRGLGSIPSVRGPEDTKAFVENQYEAFKTLTEKLGMTIQ